jgi:flavin-dependent dehydrogenase
MNLPDYDVAVVGAGPAGSAAAASIARAGLRVLLVEKDVFPRAKVCGEFLAADALSSLERLGARAAVEAAVPERIDRGRIHLRDGAAVAFTLPRPGLGLSREVFDALLARFAAELGAELATGCRVAAIDGSPSTGFTLDGSGADGGFRIRAALVVGAWGRWDALDRSLGRAFLARPERFFGWNLDLAGDSAFLAGQVRLYVFPGGYCGLSRVERGAVNLAGVIAERQRRLLASGWDSVLDHARGNRALAADLDQLEPGPRGFLGTGPVFFTAKPPVERGMLMVGDAAGVLDPFSGEGQASALASGLLAGDTAVRALRGEIAPPDLPRVYAARWRQRFARRFAWSAFFRRLMLKPSLGSAAARLAGRPIVELAARSLGR